MPNNDNNSYNAPAQGQNLELKLSNTSVDNASAKTATSATVLQRPNSQAGQDTAPFQPVKPDQAPLVPSAQPLQPEQQAQNTPAQPDPPTRTSTRKTRANPVTYNLKELSRTRVHTPTKYTDGSYQRKNGGAPIELVNKPASMSSKTLERRRLLGLADTVDAVDTTADTDAAGATGVDKNNGDGAGGEGGKPKPRTRARPERRNGIGAYVDSLKAGNAQKATQKAGETGLRSAVPPNATPDDTAADITERAQPTPKAQASADKSTASCNLERLRSERMGLTQGLNRLFVKYAAEENIPEDAANRLFRRFVHGQMTGCRGADADDDVDMADDAGADTGAGDAGDDVEMTDAGIDANTRANTDAATGAVAETAGNPRQVQSEVGEGDEVAPADVDSGTIAVALPPGHVRGQPAGSRKKSNAAAGSKKSAASGKKSASALAASVATDSPTPTAPTAHATARSGTDAAQDGPAAMAPKGSTKKGRPAGSTSKARSVNTKNTRSSASTSGTAPADTNVDADAATTLANKITARAAAPPTTGRVTRAAARAAAGDNEPALAAPLPAPKRKSRKSSAPKEPKKGIFDGLNTPIEDPYARQRSAFGGMLEAYANENGLEQDTDGLGYVSNSQAERTREATRLQEAPHLYNHREVDERARSFARRKWAEGDVKPLTDEEKEKVRRITEASRTWGPAQQPAGKGTAGQKTAGLEQETTTENELEGVANQEQQDTAGSMEGVETFAPHDSTAKTRPISPASFTESSLYRDVTPPCTMPATTTQAQPEQQPSPQPSSQGSHHSSPRPPRLELPTGPSQPGWVPPRRPTVSPLTPLPDWADRAMADYIQTVGEASAVINTAVARGQDRMWQDYGRLVDEVDATLRGEVPAVEDSVGDEEEGDEEDEHEEDVDEEDTEPHGGLVNGYGIHDIDGEPMSDIDESESEASEDRFPEGHEEEFNYAEPGTPEYWQDHQNRLRELRDQGYDVDLQVSFADNDRSGNFEEPDEECANRNGAHDGMEMDQSDDDRYSTTQEQSQQSNAHDQDAQPTPFMPGYRLNGATQFAGNNPDAETDQPETRTSSSDHGYAQEHTSSSPNPSARTTNANELRVSDDESRPAPVRDDREGSTADNPIDLSSNISSSSCCSSDAEEEDYDDDEDAETLRRFYAEGWNDGGLGYGV